MEDNLTTSPTLLLKRNIVLRVIVTERWKTEMQEQYQRQLQQIDGQIQQLEFQGKRAIAEIEKKTIQPAGPEATQQIEMIKAQVNDQKSKLLNQKTQILQQQTQVAGLALEQEVAQGTVESFFQATVGDNLVQKMQVDIVVQDGIIKEIRGNP